MPPHDQWERALRAEGFPRVAGVDEAGRGPLAGPVSAAAVILDPAAVPPGIDDSKALTADRREALCDAILRSALAVGIGLAPAAEIDALNIRQATFAAMRRAVRGLGLAPDHLLIDGRDVPPGLPCPARALVKGDALSLSIAAASIVAKVTRDRLMARLDLAHPAYGFRIHKGYPTAAHRAAILRHGPSPCHRLSFGSVARSIGPDRSAT
ncbi:ribonuclease HII [Lichenibacterium minor]|uniref:ribonuclease HII n=1 Tax=Lichenibacterium minor TaxID=2316528 RepID=UPI001FDF7422|nr:ribonuclease HII [Lichenibacterium minor]